MWVIIDVVAACISVYQCISIPRHSPVCRAAAPTPGYFMETPSPAQHISVSNQGYNYTSHNQSDFTNAPLIIAVLLYCMILYVCNVQCRSHIKEVQSRIPVKNTKCSIITRIVQFMIFGAVHILYPRSSPPRLSGGGSSSANW